MSSTSDIPLAELDTNVDTDAKMPKSSNLKLDIQANSVEDDDKKVTEMAPAIPRIAAVGNFGKVANSPRCNVPVDKSNDISAMSEFATEPANDKEDLRPLNERLVSKKMEGQKSCIRGTEKTL